VVGGRLRVWTGVVTYNDEMKERGGGDLDTLEAITCKTHGDQSRSSDHSLRWSSSDGGKAEGQGRRCEESDKCGNI
jgi:hypothetical protein